jgi:hypothetical protein
MREVSQSEESPLDFVKIKKSYEIRKVGSVKKWTYVAELRIKLIPIDRCESCS